jgi:hypothetical protein
MAIPGGYRFRVPFDDVFPQGCYVMSVERARDYNNGKPKDAVDPVSGKPVCSNARARRSPRCARPTISRRSTRSSSPAASRRR